VPRADAGGVELYYESLGEGTPLIMQGHDHSPWLFFQAPYFSQRYRFLTFDRRGTGRSACPDGDWSIADFARDLIGLLDALGVDQAIIGGSSLGGIITAQVAVDFPERAQALIIGHTTPYFWDLGLQWLDELIVAASSGLRALGDQPRSFEWEQAGPPTTDPAFAASDIGRLMASIGTGMGRDSASLIKMLRAIRGWDQRPRYADLARVSVPALVIVGSREPQKTIELAHEWHQQIPRSEFIVLRDAHHAAHRERGYAWNAAVQGFLDRHGLT
jgi:pimeloyl-ACP methyl ester carboxylesterase